MICTTMVFIMSCYNIAIIEGFSLSIFKHAIMGFPLAFVYALIGDDSIAKVGLCMSFFTGCGMVIWMSLFGVVTNIGLSSNFVYAYIIAMFTNFIFAIPLNLLIVSPLMRFLFFKLFPPIGHIDNQRKAV